MKRMMLVPTSHSLPSPLMQKLTELDEEMKSVLLRTDLDQSAKAIAYSQILDKYLKVKQKVQRPEPIPVIEQVAESTDGGGVSSLSSTSPRMNKIDARVFPKQFQNRAQNLLNHISQSSNLDWDEKGVVIIDGKPIAGSNIIDLVSEAIRPNQTSQHTGSIPFMKSLIESNVPRSWLGSRKLIPETSQLPVTPDSTSTKTISTNTHRKIGKSTRSRRPSELLKPNTQWELY